MKKVYIGLGSNIGDREGFLRQSLKLLGERCGTITQRSSVYETSPVGFIADKDFLNMVVLLETDLEPAGLMRMIMEIETELGRKRLKKGYSSRTIDIDLLLYNNVIMDDEIITLPHPRMHERRFVLEPLHEIAPDLIHPVLTKSVKQLLSICSDTDLVRKSF